MASPLLSLKFSGLIRDLPLKKVTGPEFMNAIDECGWKEGTGTHFFRELRKDGPSRGIKTLGDLQRAIRKGYAVKGDDGKTLHWIKNGTAYIVFNPKTRTLITFSQGKDV